MSATAAMAQESLTRATSSQSVMNYASIYQGFMEMGIPESEIKPRENVFTFWAWKALGRRVRKGQHGVKAVTFIPVSESVDDKTGEKKSGYRMPRTTTVFHISQTEPEPGQNDGGIFANDFTTTDERAAKMNGPCMVCGFGTIKSGICSFCG